MVVVLDREGGAMTPDQMLAVHREHRAAEDRHDFSAVMATLASDLLPRAGIAGPAQ
jgi:hypothetical protein